MFEKVWIVQQRQQLLQYQTYERNNHNYKCQVSQIMPIEHVCLRCGKGPNPFRCAVGKLPEARASLTGLPIFGKRTKNEMLHWMCWAIWTRR